MDPKDPLDQAPVLATESQDQQPSSSTSPELPSEQAPSLAGSEGSPSPLFPAPLGKWQARRVTLEQYELLYKAWNVSPHPSVLALSKQFGFAQETIANLIKRGNRVTGWMAFTERRIAEDAAVIAAREKAAPAIAKLIVDDFERAQKENLALLNGMRAGTAMIVNKYIQAARSASFVKHRRVRDKQGNLVSIEVPMDAAEAADVGRTLMSLLDSLIHTESFAQGGPDGRVDVDVKKGMDLLNDKQVQWVIDHDGLLPPDLDPAVMNGAGKPASN